MQVMLRLKSWIKVLNNGVTFATRGTEYDSRGVSRQYRHELGSTVDGLHMTSSPHIASRSHRERLASQVVDFDTNSVSPKKVSLLGRVAQMEKASKTTASLVPHSLEAPRILDAPHLYYFELVESHWLHLYRQKRQVDV